MSPLKTQSYYLASGLRYTTATLDVREQVAFQDAELQSVLRALLSFSSIEEAAILTTCNRVELYLRVNNVVTAMQQIRQFFIQQKHFDPAAHPGCLFTYVNEDAIRHLMSVSAGLDSLILGEGQILSQVKDTYAQAQKAGTCGRFLNKLFNMATALGKQVRSQTGISSRDASVSKAALAKASLNDAYLYQRHIAVVGGGKMASLILERLSQEIPPEERHRVRIINRSPHRLDELTQRYGFDGGTWECVQDTLNWADVVFVATGAPHLLFYTEQFEGLHPQPRAIYDISVPRNVCDEVKQFPWLSLYNTDDLQGLHGFSVETEQRLRANANALIDDAFDEIQAWERSLPTVSVLDKLRQQVEQVRRNELASIKTQPSPKLEELDAWSRVFINRLMHQPTVQLKHHAVSDPHQAKAFNHVLHHLLQSGLLDTACSETL